MPGLVLRVTDRGHKSFALRCRYPSHPDNPTRRALGDYGAMSLDDARQKARRWLELIGKGIDPKIEEARQKAEAQRRQVNTFAAVAADFVERHAAKLAKSKEIERILDAEFVKRWGAAAGDRDPARRGCGRDSRRSSTAAPAIRPTTPLRCCGGCTAGRSAPASTGSTRRRPNGCSLES